MYYFLLNDSLNLPFFAAACDLNLNYVSFALKVIKLFLRISMKIFTDVPDFCGESHWCSQAQILLVVKDFKICWCCHKGLPEVTTNYMNGFGKAITNIKKAKKNCLPSNLRLLAAFANLFLTVLAALLPSAEIGKCNYMSS
jgi:hypothetical protein